MDRHARRWLLVIAVIVILSLGFIRFNSHTGAVPTVATITSHQNVVESIRLDQVKAPYEITVSTPDGGHNTIAVRPGEIEVIQADCPDQTCVRQGAIANSAMPIVCLPHRLVIQIESLHENESSAPPDAVAT